MFVIAIYFLFLVLPMGLVIYPLTLLPNQASNYFIWRRKNGGGGGGNKQRWDRNTELHIFLFVYEDHGLFILCTQPEQIFHFLSDKLKWKDGTYVTTLFLPGSI